jgi:uncharacterized protein YprB with RNaseH-like and TPR domain
LHKRTQEASAMLRQCFGMFPGVDRQTVRRMQTLGISNWHDALDNLDVLPVSKQQRSHLREHVEDAVQHYDQADTTYFANLLRPKETWRLFSSFPERCIFFDIETTGLDTGSHEITVICTYSPAGRTFAHFVRGENLDRFPESLRDGDVLIGFNSRAFDMPFLRRRFGSRLPPVNDADLRWVLDALNVRGRLKEIERTAFHLMRPDPLRDFDGEDAITAWHAWEKTGDRDVLDKLVLHCTADAYVLDFMLRGICRRMGCLRFRSDIAPATVFRTAKTSEWALALPDIPPPVDLREAAEPPPEEPAPAAEPARREAATPEELEYRLIYLMALADEEIADEERQVLDLFATLHGLSKAEQRICEISARRFYQDRGLAGIGSLILRRGRRQAQQDLQRLITFAFVDGSLDQRERKLILALARRLKLPQDRLDEMRATAIERGRKLTARLK